MCECNKGGKFINKVLYHTFGKLKKNVYRNKKRKSPLMKVLMNVCMCHSNSYLFMLIEA